MCIRDRLLESGTVGLNDKEEKEERLSKDLNKSVRIKENLNEFVKDWEKLDFFSKQKVRNNDDFFSQREIRLSHDKFQLSKSLEAFSLGNMPYMMNNYMKLSFPVIIINGKDDIKFIKEGRVMLNANKNSNQYIISNAGHNVHLENPELYIAIISEFDANFEVNQITAKNKKIGNNKASKITSKLIINSIK